LVAFAGYFQTVNKAYLLLAICEISIAAQLTPQVTAADQTMAEADLAAEVPEVAALVAVMEVAPAAVVPVVEVVPAEATAVMDCLTARR
jgi:hypothetical protein